MTTDTPRLFDLPPADPAAAVHGIAVSESMTTAATVADRLAWLGLPAGAYPTSMTRSAGTRRTLTARLVAEAGANPLRLTSPPAEHPDALCDSCAHVQRVSHRARVYYKCDQVRPTHGPGTDLRLAWPACADYDPADGQEQQR